MKTNALRRTAILIALLIAAPALAAAGALGLAPASFTDVSPEDLATFRSLDTNDWAFGIEAHQLTRDGEPAQFLERRLSFEEMIQLAAQFSSMPTARIRTVEALKSYKSIRFTMYRNSPNDPIMLRNFRTAMQIFGIRTDETMSAWQAIHTYRSTGYSAQIDYYVLVNRNTGRVVFLFNGFRG